MLIIVDVLACFLVLSFPEDILSVLASHFHTAQLPLGAQRGLPAYADRRLSLDALPNIDISLATLRRGTKGHELDTGQAEARAYESGAFFTELRTELSNRTAQHGLTDAPPRSLRGHGGRGGAGYAGRIQSTSSQKRSGYAGLGTKADLDNHANQMNPNNWRYWSSRGLEMPSENAAYTTASSRRRGGYKGLGTKADLDNHANQMNPNNWRYWSSRGISSPAKNGGLGRSDGTTYSNPVQSVISGLGAGTDVLAPFSRRRGGYAGFGTKADLDNHANQMNPNNWRYWISRGMAPPWVAQRCRSVLIRRLGDGEEGVGMKECEEIDTCVCHELVESFTGDSTPSSVNIEDVVTACESDAATRCEVVDLIAKARYILLFAITISQYFFAMKYGKHVVAKKPKLQDVDAIQEEWRVSGHRFRTSVKQECCSVVPALVCQSEDLSLCLHSCFCTVARMSDTYASAGLGSFCTHFLISVALFNVFYTNVGGIVGIVAGGVARAVYFTLRRAQLRRRLGGSGCLATDFCCVLWCMPCVACQEARQLDGALGIRVLCCCVVTEAPECEVPLVGMPVSLTVQARAARIS